MKKILTCLVAVLLAIPALAAHHESAEAEVNAAVVAFNEVCATKDVESYFSNYTEIAPEE